MGVQHSFEKNETANMFFIKKPSPVFITSIPNFHTRFILLKDLYSIKHDKYIRNP